MTCKDNFLVNSVKQFGGKQSNIILDGLEFIRCFISHNRCDQASGEAYRGD